MTGYIVRRCIAAAIIAVGVAAVVYALLAFTGGSPAAAALGTHYNRYTAASWNKAHGFDRPLVVQILSYIWNAAQLKFGYSYRQGQSVGALLNENAGRTAYLSGAALILAILIAIPLGIAQAVKRNSVGDYVATTATFTLYSMPSFFLGLIMIQIFALDLHLFPALVSDNITTTWQAVTHPVEMTLPIVTLAGLQVASFSRYMRSSALDVLAQDYIRLARAKGLSERLVLTRHLLRNACLPIITLIGLSIPNLLAGNIITEGLFNYPGLGLLFFDSLQSLDYPVLLAYTVIGGVLVVVGNLIADIAVTVADPRIRLG
jgi:peptide/nickel transport system permease protein